MEKYLSILLLVGLVRCQSSTVASSCAATLSSHASPSVAPGYVARLVANDLNTPRGIKFDSQGNLLVVESGTGITALKIKDDGNGCLSSPSRSTVIDDESLNHGIEISPDGGTLYASNSGSAYSWDYNANTQRNTSAPTTLVTGMINSDHTTRTLLLSRSAPGLLLISRGSTSNIDPLASRVGTGHSQIKAFNITDVSSPYDFTDDGLMLGWGLRNDVGMAEHPTTGGIYSVENSVDEMHRNGVDIHQTNPGEELNFLGYLDGTESSNQGRNFGYPECYSAWNVGTIPNFDGKVGQQFAIGNVTARDDEACSEAKRQKPRLVFHPHMAPLDIKFNDEGTVAWVTFHGSWNSDPPVGESLSVYD
jgi:glucose/arabinose dehydrogenase